MNGSDIFNYGLKAWVDHFIGCCGRMYTEYFFGSSMSRRHFF